MKLRSSSLASSLVLAAAAAASIVTSASANQAPKPHAGCPRRQAGRERQPRLAARLQELRQQRRSDCLRARALDRPTSEGGYVVAGNWSNSIARGSCCRGALLLKLDANGHSQWQRAYSGGVYCFSYGCDAIGPIVYSVHQASDGGYAVAGAGNALLPDSATLVPWLAK